MEERMKGSEEREEGRGEWQNGIILGFPKM